MYFEKAIVKTYNRNYNNKKVPYNQLHLGKAEDSEFNKNPEEPDEVAVIKILDFEDLVEKAKPTELNELKSKYIELQDENFQLKQQVGELEGTAKSLASDVNELTKEKLQLQEELIKVSNNLTDKAEELTEEKETSKGLLATITKVTNEKAEVEKENIFLKNRSLVSRILNKQYTKETDVPEIVEAEAKPSEEAESNSSEE